MNTNTKASPVNVVLQQEQTDPGRQIIQAIFLKYLLY